MTNGGTLIHTFRKGAHLRHTRRNFHPQQKPARSGFGALPHDDFKTIRAPEMIKINSVACGRHLIDQFLGGLAFFLKHAAFPGAGHCTNFGGTISERGLGGGAERSKGHRGNINRNFQFKRIFHDPATTTKNGRCITAFTIAFQRKARHSRRHKGQIVKGRQTFVKGVIAAHLIAAQLGERVHF